MESQVSYHSTLQVDVKIPALEPERDLQTPSPVQQIGLVFTYQITRSRFHVAEDGARTLVWRRKGLRVPLCDHQLSVDIFNHGDDSLHRYLSWSFMSFEEDIDAGTVADVIIDRWVQIRDNVNARSSDKIFPLTVNLILCRIEMHHEMPLGMIPACDRAIKEMLKRVRIEEIEEIEEGRSGQEEAQSCVICLEKFRKDGRYALQMPCLHVFHGKCIEKWLKKSHYCPTCRFQMPTN